MIIHEGVMSPPCKYEIECHFILHERETQDRILEGRKGGSRERKD
jgi:hypothetical protein